MLFRTIATAALAVTISTTALAESTHWVTSDRLNRRTCPSTQCGVVGQLFHREGVTIHEQRGRWARVSRYYDAACRAGRSDYVDDENSRCTSDNGIVNGQMAEWVSLRFLSTSRPADPAANASGMDALIAGSDDYRIHRAAFVTAAQSLISSGRCTEADFRENGGWLKSMTHRDRPIYFTYCGGLTRGNRLYLDASTGNVFR